MTSHPLAPTEHSHQHHERSHPIPSKKPSRSIPIFFLLCWSYLLAAVALLLTALFWLIASRKSAPGEVGWALFLLLGLAISGISVGISGVLMLLKLHHARLAATISLALLLSFLGVLLLRGCYGWLFPPTALMHLLAQRGWDVATMQVEKLSLPFFLLTLTLYVVLSVYVILGMRKSFRVRRRRRRISDEG